MAGLTWDLDATVRAPPDVVYAWMTDFREDDHRSPAFRRGAKVRENDPRDAKRVVVARKGNEVTLEDTWGRQRFRTTATLDGAQRTITIRGEFGYQAVWRAAPVAGGTRISIEGRMAPGGVFGLLLPLFAKKMRQQTEDDFRGHVADLEASLDKR
jgi:polyketide cyclase/dehydrase/lipid transport protein